MNSWTLATLAVVCFTPWPLFMNKSGLNGFVAAACFAAASFIGVLPMALKTNYLNLPNADWRMVAAAGFSGAVGLTCFTGLLSRVQPRDLGPYLVIVSLIQVVMNAALFVGGCSAFHKNS